MSKKSKKFHFERTDTLKNCSFCRKLPNLEKIAHLFPFQVKYFNQLSRWFDDNFLHVWWPTPTLEVKLSFLWTDMYRTQITSSKRNVMFFVQDLSLIWYTKQSENLMRWNSQKNLPPKLSEKSQKNYKLKSVISERHFLIFSHLKLEVNPLGFNWEKCSIYWKLL